jgi:oxepin-CoA hydrolase / 3-oxo-5,6-dehydrosuberyl-CoA semialdehyde dehydrogenase
MKSFTGSKLAFSGQNVSDLNSYKQMQNKAMSFVKVIAVLNRHQNLFEMKSVKTINNFVLGKWINGDGPGIKQYDAITGAQISIVSSEGLDYDDILTFARKHGGPALRKMTFQERGLMLKALALYLMDQKELFYESSWLTGATKADSWVDIEGGIGNLFANASLRRKFGDQPWYVEGDTARLGKNGTFVGQHLLTPKPGVAIHINAFNFPVWGMLEKVAVNLLAGMPAVVKASEHTSFLTECVVQSIVKSGILPKGALQLITGSGRGLLDATLTPQDVVTFTGSAKTGKMLKAHPSMIAHSVPFTMEADSLNAIVLGKDAAPGTPDFDLFIKEVRREMTTKAGQKCTAVRRIMVPEGMQELVSQTLAKELGKTTIGDPRVQGVRMGALINQEQKGRVMAQLSEMLKVTPALYGQAEPALIMGDHAQMGAFMSPVLMYNDQPLKKKISHEAECFGPVSTLMAYKNQGELYEMMSMGRGSLVCTVVTSDPAFYRSYVHNTAAWHGRVHILNEKSAPESTGHGAPLPLLVHGGPGHAGGGEEMGGMRGVMHYMQRTAIQGHPTDLTRTMDYYLQGSEYIEPPKHPFQLYFEELSIGHTWITAKHTVSEADITNFANVSGDNFYAHMDDTALAGTPFERRVAHGYFVLSKAAGLFVDARKGPVLLNYGLDECRFTKPVYPGMTIGVRFTCREKIKQEQRTPEDTPKGIVKWLVDVYDETGETVAIATILTMVMLKPAVK